MWFQVNSDPEKNSCTRPVIDQPCHYGGQAVIEGVVMRGKRDLAIAVRRSDDSIIIEEEKLSSLVDRYKFLSWPVIRGTVVLVETMIMGIRALNFSANQIAEEEGEEITPLEMTVTMLVSLLLATALFVAIPTGAVHFMRGVAESVAIQNLIEGIIRIAIFLGYVWLVAQMDDIKRVFEYHGAEHKVIYTYEAGEPLTIENARQQSTLHPRCGTAFLLVVMVVSIIVFSFLGEGSLLWRISSRIVLLPVVAGIAYEIIKYVARKQGTFWGKIVLAPGLWLQKLTTREPDDQQIEVAIRALQRVLEIEERVALEQQPISQPIANPA
jgi:uncharacterized protein YqhQ